LNWPAEAAGAGVATNRPCAMSNFALAKARTNAVGGT
jgi:hypothetical protein